ncbi:DUF4173 domain-containing protein [Mangrovicella endophytica]|uniref:DUF4153 domain-containing protein n=1 Tax=Mangrovicella endophytica TaxID=2066697 RepID=UPI0012FFF363|nr:DUF4173 domain-containing protein [Mangrovicella endophytica]
MTPARFAAPRLRDYAVAALLLTTAADFLLFRSFERPGGLTLTQPIGLPVPLLLLTVGLGVVLCNRRSLGVSAIPTAILLTGAALALAETVGRLQVVVGLTCLAAFALAAAGRLPHGPAAARAVLRFLVTSPAAFCLDEVRRRRAAKSLRDARRMSAGRLVRWTVWIMPLILAGGFIILLGAGNPIVEHWLWLIDLSALIDLLEPARLIFWILAFVLIWPFLRPRLRHLSGRAIRPSEPAARASDEPPALPSGFSSTLFGADSILRALVLFNAVFAVQTVLDSLYLWGGKALPDGITYAEYAHRGAYTLVATALCAAAFVLLAMRPGSAAASDRWIRALVYLWTAQTVVLVLSAMRRLDLYVDVYALTHWRVAAFLWMALVMVGLVLIVARIALARSNDWLVMTNLTVAAGMIYGCAFADFDALIARFNVEHSREMTGTGAFLDIDHLSALGPSALPALDTLLEAMRSRPIPQGGWEARKMIDVQSARDILLSRHRARALRWRSWTFRSERLSRYLELSRLGGRRWTPFPW